MDYLLIQNWDPILLMDVLGVVVCGTLILLLWDRSGRTPVETHRPSRDGAFIGEITARLIRQETQRALEQFHTRLATQLVCGTTGEGRQRAPIRIDAHTQTVSEGTWTSRRRHPAKAIYTRARQMAELGVQPLEIARRIALPRCEIELISKTYRQGKRIDVFAQHAMAA